MSRDSSLYLKDILQAADYILADIKDRTRTQLETDRVLLQAILYNVMILGEAVKALPVAYREAHTEIDWRGAAGMRDILIHRYYSTDVDLVWDAITEKLPRLRDQITALLKDDRATD
jgi:uncharacterized protein with HEPN domain